MSEALVRSIRRFAVDHVLWQEVAVAVAGGPEFGGCVVRLRLAEGDVGMTSLAGRPGPRAAVFGSGYVCGMPG